MGRLTSKTIKPCSSGYAKNMVATAATLAQVDASLAAHGADKVGGCTVTGPWSLAQDAANPSSHASVTAPILITGAGSVIGTGPGGGEFVVASPPTFSAPRTRRVRIPVLEVFRSTPTISAGVLTAGSAPVIDPATAGVSQAIANDASSAQLVFPLTKPHDGATVISCGIYFYVPSLPTNISAAGEMFMFFEITYPAVGSVARIVGYNTINVGALTPTQWYANGAVQSIFVTTSTPSTGGSAPLGATGSGLAGPGSNVINLSAHSYLVSVQGPSTNGAGALPNPIITGIELTYSYTDERFTQ